MPAMALRALFRHAMTLPALMKRARAISLPLASLSSIGHFSRYAKISHSLMNNLSGESF